MLISKKTNKVNAADAEIQSGETYYYWLEALNEDFSFEHLGPVQVFVKEAVPKYEIKATAFTKAYPNPFNPETTIEFEIKNDDSFVELKIYNIKGELVKNLVQESCAKGVHRKMWDGKNEAEKSVSWIFGL